MALTRLTALLLLAAALPAAAEDYFVDSRAGSDENAGTRPDRPWQTLFQVQNARLQPGDTVRFLAGGTWTGLLLLKASRGSPSRSAGCPTLGRTSSELGSEEHPLMHRSASTSN